MAQHDSTAARAAGSAHFPAGVVTVAAPVHPRHGAVRRVPALLVVGVALFGCGGGNSHASVADRTTTAGVCLSVSGEVATAVSVGVKLAAQSLTPPQAQAQLQPVLAKVSILAQQNARLPIGPKLQTLADAISTAEHAPPGDPAQVRAAATDIGSAAKGVLQTCGRVAG